MLNYPGPPGYPGKQQGLDRGNCTHRRNWREDSSSKHLKGSGSKASTTRIFPSIPTCEGQQKQQDEEEEEEEEEGGAATAFFGSQ
jgi:hypothetical protein